MEILDGGEGRFIPRRGARRRDGRAHQRLAPRRRRLGEILLDQGVVGPAALRRALAAQRETGVRLGDMLIAREAADRTGVARALAAQLGVAFADMDDRADAGRREPGKDDLARFLLHDVLPIGRDGEHEIIAAADVHLGLRAARGAEARTRYVLAERRALRAHAVARFQPEIAHRAATRRPEALSLRRGAARWQRALTFTAPPAFVAAMILAPTEAAAAAVWLAVGIIGVNGALWAAALFASLVGPRPVPPADTPKLASYRKPPRVSILIPLYREPETASALVAAIAAIDYPAELLDVKLVLENGDEETRGALTAQPLPPFAEILVAPDGEPRTKPRALNFALDFAEGEIIGVYDAEDRPPPDQVRKIVAQFAESSPEIACIQARLGYYNVEENWLTRCFEAEYAGWFETMLPGLLRLGLPLPLGGTSLFVRRGALEDVGGWDSHNVTEDADLGMLLARRGLRTALCDSLTEEEASSRPLAWIRQRSRWLKGYLATWTTHMRRPGSLFRDLGAFGFIGFNAILLSAVLGYLALPFLWVTSLVSGPWSDAAGLGALKTATALSLPVLFFAAAIGLSRRNRLAYWPWILTTPLYWCLGAAAAYLAIWELATAPTKWRKTRHGVGRIAGRLREEAEGAANAARPGVSSATGPGDPI